MASTNALSTDTKQVTIRSERVYESDLDSETIPLSHGGEVRITSINDVQDHVGPISPKNEYRIRERESHISIIVYREKNRCSVGKCNSIADQKFDGNWLCSHHLNSYTARHI